MLPKGIQEGNRKFNDNRYLVKGTSEGTQTVSSDVNFSDLNVGGAERLKFWTYTYVLTAVDVGFTAANIAITAVDLTKIRALIAVVYDVSATDVFAWQDNALAFYVQARLTNPTNCGIDFGGNYVAGDVASLTIIEAA